MATVAYTGARIACTALGAMDILMHYLKLETVLAYDGG